MARPGFKYSPPSGEIGIYHADDHVLALEKPSGLLSVPGKASEHADCVEARMRLKFPTASIVHRLDLDTSGVMVMALTMDAHRHLSAQFERRKITKLYVAKVWGRPISNRGTVTLPLRPNWFDKPKQMVDFETGREALTRWQVLESDGETSRVALYPHTGRSHQLRVHMAQIGCAILGDRFYAHQEALAMSERLLLHAERLQFTHPRSGDLLQFVSEPPF